MGMIGREDPLDYCFHRKL